MPVMLEMVGVVRVTGHVHKAGIPIAGTRDGLRPPVRPDAELGVAEPRRRLVGLQRICRRLEGTARDCRLIGRRRCWAAFTTTILMRLCEGLHTDRGPERCSQQGSPAYHAVFLLTICPLSCGVA